MTKTAASQEVLDEIIAAVKSGIPVCTHCGCNLLRKGQKYCAKEECQDARRKKNRLSYERKDRGESRLRHDSYMRANHPPKGCKEVNCLGLGCSNKVLSPVDKQGHALKHFCVKCQRAREDGETIRFAECYG